MLFGRSDVDLKRRDVVEVGSVPLNRWKNVTLQCYVVHEISSIANAHLEMVTETYPHVDKIWFSDICRYKERIKIYISIC